MTREAMDEWAKVIDAQRRAYDEGLTSVSAEELERRIDAIYGESLYEDASAHARQWR